jgi:hypothetical protein
LSPSATSEPVGPAGRPGRALQGAWRLAQTCWVGGLWLLHFVILPAIGKVGLVPLLVEEIRSALTPLLLLIALAAMLVQALLLIWGEGLSSLWRDYRGQLLLAGSALVAVYFSVLGLQLEAPRWLVFNYLMVAVTGLVLVLQPSPGRRSATVSG